MQFSFVQAQSIRRKMASKEVRGLVVKGPELKTPVLRDS